MPCLPSPGIWSGISHFLALGSAFLGVTLRDGRLAKTDLLLPNPERSGLAGSLELQLPDMVRGARGPDNLFLNPPFLGSSVYRVAWGRLQEGGMWLCSPQKSPMARSCAQRPSRRRDSKLELAVNPGAPDAHHQAFPACNPLDIQKCRSL